MATGASPQPNHGARAGPDPAGSRSLRSAWVRVGVNEFVPALAIACEVLGDVPEAIPFLHGDGHALVVFGLDPAEPVEEVIEAFPSRSILLGLTSIGGTGLGPVIASPDGHMEALVDGALDRGKACAVGRDLSKIQDEFGAKGVGGLLEAGMQFLERIPRDVLHLDHQVAVDIAIGIQIEPDKLLEGRVAGEGVDPAKARAGHRRDLLRGIPLRHQHSDPVVTIPNAKHLRRLRGRGLAGAEVDNFADDFEAEVVHVSDPVDDRVGVTM
jgi:hypothetical protein